jgi:hypothetical protein
MLRRLCRWRILPALLLAIATTYLTAWSSFFWPGSRFFSPTDLARGPIPSAAGLDAVFELTAWRSRAYDLYSSTSSEWSLYFRQPRRLSVSEIAPPQILALLSLKPGIDDQTDRYVITRGWPFRSLASVVSSKSTPIDLIETTNHGITLPDRYQSWPDRYAIPTLHLFPGFILNTALAAPLWWFLLTAPPAIRRHFRKQAHQCPHCAYDRQGLPPTSPCPECGHA